MYESIISACKALDAFGLPRAVGNLRTDRFVTANNAFLRLLGLEQEEISIIALSDIVRMHPKSTNEVKIGELVPITVRSSVESEMIGGQAAFGTKGLLFLMIPGSFKPDQEFEVGTAVGKELEKLNIRDYVHQHLAPEFMSVIFSLESIKAQLEKDNHPCAGSLKRNSRTVHEAA
jgi:hypothetical protein